MMGRYRQDNLDRGRLRHLGATLIPSRAAAKRFADGLCRARKGVGQALVAGLRDVPFPPERVAASMSAHHARAGRFKQH
jgi:hypothetical protein